MHAKVGIICQMTYILCIYLVWGQAILSLFNHDNGWAHVGILLLDYCNEILAYITIKIN